MRRFGRSAIMACGLAALSLATAAAAPAVPGWVAYSNGTVMGEGEPGLCVVDAVMIDPGGEDTVDLGAAGVGGEIGACGTSDGASAAMDGASSRSGLGGALPGISLRTGESCGTSCAGAVSTGTEGIIRAGGCASIGG